MNKKQTTIITALSVIAFVLALLVSGRYWTRLDLTKNKAYTISKVSRNLYKEIPDPVNISYYLSDKLRGVHPAPQEIEDTLREYAAYSRGKIRLMVRDPVKAGVTAMIEELGMQPMQVRNVEQDQASFITVYSGIMIEYLDKLEVIPWIIDTGTLEYDLTTRIRAMARNSERQIGVIVGDSFRKWEEDFRYLASTFLSGGYRVRVYSPGEEIPDMLPALFVFGGEEDMDENALYRIDRYIQCGGKVLFAQKGIYVDTVYGTIEARALKPPNYGQYNDADNEVFMNDDIETQGDQSSFSLLKMISSYGARIQPGLVLDRNALFIEYQTRTPTGMIQRRITRYPLWIGVLGENGNPNHPVSSNFSGLDIYWASPIELSPPASVNAEYLFTSSDTSWLQTQSYYTSPEIPYMLEIEANETRGKKVLAASLQGFFPSYFEDKPKPAEDLPDMPASTSLSRIIVIGDVDFATNMMNATDAIKNLDFLMRAADWLANDDDVIDIRARQPQTGRLDKILDPANKRAAMRFSQILNVGIVPAFVIILGLYLASRRKKRAGMFSSSQLQETVQQDITERNAEENNEN